MDRPNPFDLVFRDLEPALDGILADAKRQGRDPRDPLAFAQVPAAQRLLGRLESPEVMADHPEAAAEYLTLLYAAFRYWEAGERVLAVQRATLEPVLDVVPRGRIEVPGAACYVRLPAQWFWARVADDAPHEPVDGMFVAAGSRGDEVTVVAVLGLRPDRGGFSQIAVSAHPADVGAAPALARPDRFAPVMEGGARAGVRSLVSVAEVLLLVHLALDVSAG